MDTKKWWMFSWLTDTGRFKDDEFQDDLDKLRDYYREHGYLDVEIPEERIVFSYPKKDSLVITIAVNEGRQYKIGEITVTGNKLHSTAAAQARRRRSTRSPGAVFSPSKIDKAVERLEDYYGKDGYLDTRVHVTRRPNLKTNDIDLEFKIDESEKFNVESIQVEGNTKTKSVVIIRELVLGPGDVFDMVRMKISKNRLENTRFFDDVDITPQDTNIPGPARHARHGQGGADGHVHLRRGLQLARAGDRLRADPADELRPVQPPLALPGRRREVQHQGLDRRALERGGDQLRGALPLREGPGARLQPLPGAVLLRQHLLPGAPGGRLRQPAQAPVRPLPGHPDLPVRDR